MKTLIKKLILNESINELEMVLECLTKDQPVNSELVCINMINDYLSHRVMIQSQVKIRIENDIEKWPEGINEIKFDYYKYTILAYFNIVHEKSDATFYAPGGTEIKYEIKNIETIIEDVY